MTAAAPFWRMDFALTVQLTVQCTVFSSYPKVECRWQCSESAGGSESERFHCHSLLSISMWKYRYAAFHKVLQQHFERWTGAVKSDWRSPWQRFQPLTIIDCMCRQLLLISSYIHSLFPNLLSIYWHIKFHIWATTISYIAMCVNTTILPYNIMLYIDTEMLVEQ